MENIIPISHQIDWNATWLFLNNNHKRSYNYTNFQLSNSKTFHIKNLLNILPTLAHLHCLYPTTFNNNLCITCNKHEQNHHWLICPNNNILLSIIQQAIKDTFTQQVLDISVTELSALYHNLIYYYCLSFMQLPTSISPSIYSTLQGFIPIPIINTITQTNTSNKIATQLTITLLSKISQNIHNQLWKPYCTKLAN